MARGIINCSARRFDPWSDFLCVPLVLPPCGGCQVGSVGLSEAVANSRWGSGAHRTGGIVAASSFSALFLKPVARVKEIEGPRWTSRMEEDADVPAELVRCQLVPPAPNGTPNSIGWLRDFAGFSWLAYGAASVAVVTHVASPLSQREAAVGSFFHQVLEPDPPPGHSDPSFFTVRALSWCPSVPSDGTLAVALGSSISLYSPLPDCPTGKSYLFIPFISFTRLSH
ncbi:hypothetical protein EJ110_NYTH24241 [Nymphaea thermarum]|nr:hypothetical protein EJ110_NYTH24241 [Nymphaea thermarum]